MKKILFLLLLFIFAFPQISSANEVDGVYRKEILNSGYLYNTSGFFEAIRKNNAEVVKLFLQAGMNPNTTFSGTPATMHALFLDKTDIFGTLLNAGANTETEVPALWVSTKPQNLLSFAIKRKNAEAVQSLIKHGVDVNKEFNGEKPLNYAIKKKQTKIVSMLLKADAKPDEKTIKLIKKSKDKNLKILFE